jgi:hypothetical protein
LQILRAEPRRFRHRGQVVVARPSVSRWAYCQAAKKIVGVIDLVPLVRTP